MDSKETVETEGRFTTLEPRRYRFDPEVDAPTFVEVTTTSGLSLMAGERYHLRAAIADLQLVAHARLGVQEAQRGLDARVECTSSGAATPDGQQGLVAGGLEVGG